MGFDDRVLTTRNWQAACDGCFNYSATVPNSDIRSTLMNMQPQFETPREVIVISKILADLVRTLN
jgi:hypothetical protein